MRLFLAIEIPLSIREFLASLIEPKQTIDGINIVSKQNLHITIKFLGEVEEKLIPKIKEILNPLSREFSPFKLKITRPGVFPDKDKPRVIWIGTENKDVLKDLAKRIDESLSVIGFQKETREFRAHITLARVKNYQNGRYIFEKLVDKYRQISVENRQFEFSVEEFVLMKSTLTPNGSIYEVIERFNLGKSS